MQIYFTSQSSVNRLMNGRYHVHFRNLPSLISERNLRTYWMQQRLMNLIVWRSSTAACFLAWKTSFWREESKRWSNNALFHYQQGGSLKISELDDYTCYRTASGYSITKLGLIKIAITLFMRTHCRIYSSSNIKWLVYLSRHQDHHTVDIALRRHYWHISVYVVMILFRKCLWNSYDKCILDELNHM